MTTTIVHLINKKETGTVCGIALESSMIPPRHGIEIRMYKFDENYDGTKQCDACLKVSY